MASTWCPLKSWLGNDRPIAEGMTLRDPAGREWAVCEVTGNLFRIRSGTAVQMRNVDELQTWEQKWDIKEADNQERPMAQPDTVHEQIENWFTYHPPKDDQPGRYLRIRQAGLAFAKVLAENSPPSAALDEALNHTRSAVMWANAAIACGGK
jgi:hypothetical protein